MRKQNIFDLYNEQHKDDVKTADKLPGEISADDVNQEPEQKTDPEPEQKAEPKTEPTPEPKTDAGQVKESGGDENV